MKKWQVTCDRCKIEILDLSKTVKFKLEGFDWEQEADLCMSCAEKMRSMIGHMS